MLILLLQQAYFFYQKHTSKYRVIEIINKKVRRDSISNINYNHDISL